MTAQPRPDTLCVIMAMTGKRIAAVCCLSLLVACSHAGTAGIPASARDEITVAQLDSPQTMNPLFFTAGYDRAMLFPYLLKVGPDGNLRPDLASTVPSRAGGGISADGLTITYSLRKNATWGDGTPITAADVVFTCAALREPTTTLVAPSIYNDVASIRALTPFRVRVRLKHADWSFIALFLTPSTPIVPAHVFSRGPAQAGLADNPLATNPITGGPYSVVRWSRDNYLLLRANPRYFGPQPRTKYLRLRFMGDDPTFVGLLDRSLDIAIDVPMSEYTRLQHLAGYHTFVSPVAGYSAIYFNMHKPLLLDANVRKALIFGIDQAFMAKTAAYDIVRPYSGLEGTFSPFGDPHIKPLHFSPSEADALLERSGWRRGAGGIRTRNGLPLEIALVIVDTDESKRAAVLIQSEEQKIGVRVLLKSYTSTQIVAPASQNGPLAGGSFDMLFATILGYSGLLPRWWFFCASDYNENPGHYCSPHSETLYRRAMRAPNRTAIRKDFDELERNFVDDAAVVPLWQRVRIDVCRTDIAGCDSGQIAPTSEAYRLVRRENH